MRYLMRFVFGVMALVLVLPFVVSSLLLDQRGVTIAGQVIQKDEYITVGYSSWTRHMDAQVQYTMPENGGVSVHTAQLQPDQFDALKRGDEVPLRYLLAKDLPAWPGLRTMREMRALYYVRPANENTWTAPAQIMNEHGRAVLAILAVGVMLAAWRTFRLPGFLWAVAACVLVGVVLSYVFMFPEPTRAPRESVRSAGGVVKSMEKWTMLFQSQQDRDALRWMAAQPITVAAVKFVPEGKSEPVVAVDLIDDGSVAGLREQAPVEVEYESAAPRVAHIRGATRRFAQRNLAGLVTQVVYMVVVCGVVFGIYKVFGWWVRRLTARA